MFKTVRSGMKCRWYHTQQPVDVIAAVHDRRKVHTVVCPFASLVWKKQDYRLNSSYVMINKSIMSFYQCARMTQNSHAMNTRFQLAMRIRFEFQPFTGCVRILVSWESADYWDRFQIYSQSLPLSSGFPLPPPWSWWWNHRIFPSPWLSSLNRWRSSTESKSSSQTHHSETKIINALSRHQTTEISLESIRGTFSDDPMTNVNRVRL